MKKTVYIQLFVFFLITASLHAQILGLKSKNSFQLSIEPTFSYTNGTLYESIYRSADKSKKISLLEWERKIFMCGTNINAEYRNFFIDFGFSTSFPDITSGEMRDSDWQNPYDYNMKTTYSEGINYAEKNYDAAASIGYKFRLAEKFFLAPKIQCQYLYDSFYRKKEQKAGTVRRKAKPAHWMEITTGGTKTKPANIHTQTRKQEKHGLWQELIMNDKVFSSGQVFLFQHRFVKCLVLLIF